MAKIMRVAVVHAFGKPLTIEESADSDAWTGRSAHQGDGQWRLSHRLACRRRRLGRLMLLRVHGRSAWHCSGHYRFHDGRYCW
jgi:hypothetical protein